MTGTFIRSGRLLVAMVLLATITTAGASTAYQMTEVGGGRAFAINESGTVVGQTADDHAFAWRTATGVLDLHELLGLSEAASSAADVNDRGQILIGTQSGASYLFRSGASGVKRLEELPPDFFPIAINDPGTVLGGEMPAVTWTRTGGPEMIANLANADDVNNRGQVLGTTSAAWDPTLPAGINVVIVDKGGELTQLGAYDASPGYPATVVRPGAIADSGVVVYSVALYEGPGYPSELTGYRWRPRAEPLAIPSVWLTAVNESGLMAGATADQRPIVIDRDGSITFLPMPSGYRYGFAEDVNSRGEIAGYVTGQGVPDLAVWWAPVR